MRIILIDDETYGLDLLEAMIRMIDPHILISGRFENPLEAIPYVLAVKPDIVILDSQMPFLTGVDLIRMLQHTSCHFVLVSARDLSENLIQVDLKKVHLLNKPFSLNQLKSILQIIENEIIQSHKEH
jgi:YesN/AraC family two-component response regulator